MLDTLESLVKLARDRKKNPVGGSYTNKLLDDKSLSKEKVVEEINELIEAVQKNSNKIITYDQALAKINNNLFYKFLRIIITNILKLKRLRLKKESEYNIKEA